MQKVLMTLLCCATFFTGYGQGIVVNRYAAVLNYDQCRNTFLVDTAANFNVGDTILIIQMKGATIDTSNAPGFGDILSYNNAGNYEYNTISAKSGNSLRLTFKLTRTYTIPGGLVQIIRVPYVQDYTVNQPHTSRTWDGKKGGVFAINVADSLRLQNNIDVSGNGFRGGISSTIINQTVFTCNVFDYHVAYSLDSADKKGEGIAVVSANKILGRGKAANGGGGGNGHNAGGGGGSNGNAGGIGGFQWSGCNGSTFINQTGGIGGLQLAYSNASNKIFLGGGGGSGQVNDGSDGSGGNGGGIVIINANTIVSTGGKIMSNGNSPQPCVVTTATSSCHDGFGGGGAGGTVLINVNNFSGSLPIEAKGGKGGDVTGVGFNNASPGPGGGGGGGVFRINTAPLPIGVFATLTGGQNGVYVALNDSYGAQPGLQGTVMTGLQINTPVDSFDKMNVSANDSAISCDAFKFNVRNKGTTGVSQVQWDFGDGGSSSLNPATHTYAASGSYNVRAIVTDIVGCIDTLFLVVAPVPVSVSAAADRDTVCVGQPVHFAGTISGQGTMSYKWLFGDGGLVSSSSATHSFANPGLYTVQFIVANGTNCRDTDIVKIFVHAGPVFGVTPANAKICNGDTVQFFAVGGQTYHWLPTTNVSDPGVSSPFITGRYPATYTVYITDSVCNVSDTFKVSISMYPQPELTAYKSNDINCGRLSSQLQASGAFTYEWTPTASLNDHHIANPIATPDETTTYTVVGSTEYGCKDSLVLTLNVDFDQVRAFAPSAFTPNGDGSNDCFRVGATLPATKFELFVFNRWGENIFQSNDIHECWDGTYRGVAQDPGTYFYFYKIKTDICGEKSEKGTVNIIR